MKKRLTPTGGRILPGAADEAPGVVALILAVIHARERPLGLERAPARI